MVFLLFRLFAFTSSGRPYNHLCCLYGLIMGLIMASYGPIPQMNENESSNPPFQNPGSAPVSGCYIVTYIFISGQQTLVSRYFSTCGTKIYKNWTGFVCLGSFFHLENNWVEQQLPCNRKIRQLFLMLLHYSTRIDLKHEILRKLIENKTWYFFLLRSWLGP